MTERMRFIVCIFLFFFIFSLIGSTLHNPARVSKPHLNTLTTLEISNLKVFIPIEEGPETASIFYPSVGDLDNDNATLELVCANGTHAYAFNASGNLLWSISGPIQYPCIGDFDRDGYTDDLFDELGTDAYDSAGTAISVFINGSIHYANYTNGNYRSLVGDFNGDGYADDVVIERTNGTRPYLCAYSYMDPTHTFWNFSTGDASFGQKIVGGMQIGDVDGDGVRDDIVFQTYNNWTYALNESGDLLWSFPAGGQGAASPYRKNVVFGDFDADGAANEVAITTTYERRVYIINGSGAEMWNISIGHLSTGKLFVGDIDHDGFLDDVILLSGGSRQFLRVLNGSGVELWNYTSSTTIDALGLADLNGNGFKDNIIIGGWDSRAFNHTGVVIGYGQQEGSFLFVGDFDGDGLDDDYIDHYLDKHRFGTPQIQYFLQCRGCTEPYQPGDYIFFINYSSQELLPLEITRTPAGPAQYIDHISTPITGFLSPGNHSGQFGVGLRPGTYNITVTLSYKGVQFIEAWLTVTVSAPIGQPIFIICLATVGVVLSWRRRRRPRFAQISS